MKLNNNLSNNASKEYKVYEDLGAVVSVLDDVVYIVGLFNGSMSEQIEFVGKELKGVINYLDNLGMVGVTVLGNSINIMVGDSVKRLNNGLVTVKRRERSFCKAKRLRTRRVTKRYLMEHLFFLKLSKEQKKEAKLNFDLLKKELERYEKDELSFLGKVQVYCIVVGIVNSLLSAPTGIVKNLPFILYDHLSNELQWLYLIFTAFCIIVGIILTIYLTKKKWNFIKNYELECNPRIDTKKAALFFVANNGLRTVLATLSLSGILLGNTCFEKLTGKSALTLFGQ